MEISGQLYIRQCKGPGINWLEGRVGCKAGVDAMRERKFSHLPRNQIPIPKSSCR